MSSTALLSAFAFLALSVATGPTAPDSKALVYTLPGHLEWQGSPNGPQMIKLWGDPDQSGPYAVLVRWPAHVMSRPHTHPFDRHVTVISGTWWVGTGATYDPSSTTPLPAGSVVVHFANQPHYDGAKDAPCIIEITGQGPADTIPVR